MKTIKIFISIYLLFFLSFCISCKTSYPKKHPPTAATRINLQMPKLVDMKKFKGELPLDELKILRSSAKEYGYVTPVLNYFFSIDKNGNVVNGKFDSSNNKRVDFFNFYVNNTFSTYKWYPAFYSDTKEKLRVTAKMSIYDNQEENVFEVSIRLVYLPDKEKIEDILLEKNLIYRFKIH